MLPSNNNNGDMGSHNNSSATEEFFGSGFANKPAGSLILPSPIGSPMSPPAQQNSTRVLTAEEQASWHADMMKKEEELKELENRLQQSTPEEEIQLTSSSSASSSSRNSMVSAISSACRTAFDFDRQPTPAPETIEESLVHVRRPGVPFKTFSLLVDHFGGRSMAVSTTKGFKLYTINSPEKIECIFENPNEEVLIAERLFSSSLMAKVMKSNTCDLQIWHFLKGKAITNFLYSSPILSIKLNRQRIVVCVGDSLHIHNIKNMDKAHTIADTPPNPTGLMALSYDDRRSYLAYPGNSSVGEVQIFDTIGLGVVSIIRAHFSQLVAMAFSPDGLKIATASEKGTVIRVFHSVTGAKLHELRRGLTRTAKIYSLCFSPCGRFLASSSNTETIHVFKLDDHTNDSDEAGTSPPEGWMSNIYSAVSASAASYLPTQISETLSQGRAFATVHQEANGLKKICALAMVKKALRLLVASSDGYLYMYSFDEVLGGNCTLLKKFQLTEPDGTITAGSEERPANMVEFGNGVKVNGGTTGIGVDSATGKIKIMTKVKEKEEVTSTPKRFAKKKVAVRVRPKPFARVSSLDFDDEPEEESNQVVPKSALKAEFDEFKMNNGPIQRLF